METVGKRLIYTGKVQGVGFRRFAEQTAKKFPVKGYIKNLPSGQVELVCEAPKTDLEAYLKTIFTHWIANITYTEESALSPHGFQVFEML